MKKVYMSVFPTAVGGSAYFIDERAYNISAGSRLTDGWFSGDYMVLMTWPRRMRKADAVAAGEKLISEWESKGRPTLAQIRREVRLEVEQPTLI